MKIAGYLKTSLIEWPGKISSVIFVPGCNFRCPFCHNADLVRNRRLTLIDEKQIFADLKKRKKWIDGVVLTGGEPTLASDLPEFLKKLKQAGFETMIETNGSQPRVMAKLLNGQMVDFVAMDVKGPFGEYEKFIKVKSQKSCLAGRQAKVKSSVELILKSGIDFEFRTTVVPGMHDKQILIRMARELKSLIENCHWFLQNFQPKNCLDPEFEKIRPFDREEMKSFLKLVKKIIPNAELRGV